MHIQQIISVNRPFFIKTVAGFLALKLSTLFRINMVQWTMPTPKLSQLKTAVLSTKDR